MRRFFWILFVLIFVAVQPGLAATNISRTLAEAEKGVMASQLDLGKAYQYGRGVGQDYKKALFWYEKAAEQGDAEAQRPLGALYEMGQGVAQDFSKAAFWYEKAGEQGLARAQVNLGILYEKGQGVEKNPEKAFFWYQKAAVQGYGRGLNHLGMLYEKGLGVKRDVNQALHLYKQGAEAKYSKAMLNLGRIYEHGAEGVEKNLLVASAWYEWAIQIGYKNAAFDLNRVKSLLNEMAAQPQIEPGEGVQPGPQAEEKKEVEKLAIPVIATEGEKGQIAAENDGPTPEMSELDPDSPLIEDRVVDLADPSSREADRGSGQKAGPELQATEVAGPKTSVSTEDLSQLPEGMKQGDPMEVKEIQRSQADPKAMPTLYFVSLLVLGNLTLAVLFWFFMAKRKTRRNGSPAAVIKEIAMEVRAIRKQVEDLKDAIV